MDHEWRSSVSNIQEKLVHTWYLFEFWKGLMYFALLKTIK